MHKTAEAQVVDPYPHLQKATEHYALAAGELLTAGKLYEMQRNWSEAEICYDHAAQALQRAFGQDCNAGVEPMMRRARMLRFLNCTQEANRLEHRAAEILRLWTLSN